MTRFKYFAVEFSGREVTGEIRASSLEAAERALSLKQLIPTRLVVAEGEGGASGRAKPFSRDNKLKADDVTEFLRSLAVMLEAGVPLAEALQGLSESAVSVPLQTIASEMRGDLLDGKTLSQAMGPHGRAFPKIVRQMVAVSDETGQLHACLLEAIAYLDRVTEIRKSLIASLTYPMILMGASLTAFLALVVLVLPTFNEAFVSLGVKLPWYTSALVSLGIFIRQQFIVLLALGIAGFFGFRAALRRETFREKLDRFFIRLPIVGPILTQYALNRSLRTLTSLLSTGVPVIDSIGYAESVARHPWLNQAYQTVKTAVGNGAPLADSMSSTGSFPKMVIQMVSVGERTGRLAQLLKVVVDHSEVDAERRVKRAVSLMEPIVIVGMGILVGLITISILIPLFSINNNIR